MSNIKETKGEVFIFSKEIAGELADEVESGKSLPSEPNAKYRIRRLTPTECWALMGFPKEDCIKASKMGVSETQLYKQAGNSIVVDALYYIYINLYKAMPYLFDNLKVGSYFSGIGAFEKGLDRLYADIKSGAAA